MRFYNNYNLKSKLSSLLVDQLSKTYPQMLLHSSGFIQAKLLSYSYIFEFLKKDQKTPIVWNEVSICNPIRPFHFTSELDCHSSTFSNALCTSTAKFNHISDTLCKIEDNYYQ
ncbi:hypothetical protein ACJW31_01G365300 [Castanea mollissima]